MSVLIAYRSRYGTTRMCAERMGAMLGGEVALADLRRVRRPDLGPHEVVLVGGSIYAGKIQPGVPAFCERNREELLGRRVGLFICCLYEGERAQAQLNASFPAWLTAHAFATAVLGGEVVQDRLRPLDRFLVRALIKLREDRHALREDELERFCQKVRLAE